MKVRSAFQPSPSTKAYYPLNNDSNDYSGQLNTGVSTAITYPQGKFGQAAKFNGSSSNINIGSTSNLKITPSITVSLWVKAIGTTGSILTKKSSVLGGHNSYSFEQNGSNVFFRIQTTASTYSDITSSGVIVNDNNWHHILGIYNAGSQSLYIDGILRAVGGSGTVINYEGDNNLYIGCTQNTSIEFFLNGQVDEVIIESRAWTPAEVSTYYRKSMLNYRQRSYAQALKDFLIVETLALVETVTTLRTRLFTIAENLGLVETWTTLKGISFTVADTLGLIEGYTWIHNRLFTIADTLGLTELGATISKKWSNITKSVSSWTNSSKNDSDWTNLPKS
jgi:hypothetical protein